MRLVVIEGSHPGEILPLPEGETLVGRDPACALRLPSAHVSARHCTFTAGSDGLEVRDLGSTNGVWVDGRPVREARLRHRARVRIGDWTLGVDLGEPLPPPVEGAGFGRTPGPGPDSGDLPTESRPMPVETHPPPGGGGVGILRRALDRGRGLPWSLRLGSVFALAGALLLVAPGGGLLAQQARIASAAEEQAVLRGQALALALAARNADALGRHDDLRLDVSLASDAPGVRRALVTDALGRVRAPSATPRQSAGDRAAFARAAELMATTMLETGPGVWSILVPIRASPVGGGPAAPEGWAWVEFDARAAARASSPGRGRLAGALLTVGLVLGGAFVLARRLAVRPLAVLRDDLELALGGHARAVGEPRGWAQAEALARSVNRLLERWRRAGCAGGDAPGAAIADLPSPVILADARGRILHASRAACDWLGVPPGAVPGRSLTDLRSDPPLVAAWTTAVERIARWDPPPSPWIVHLGPERVTVRIAGSSPSGALLLLHVG